MNNLAGCLQEFKQKLAVQQASLKRVNLNDSKIDSFMKTLQKIAETGNSKDFYQQDEKTGFITKPYRAEQIVKSSFVTRYTFSKKNSLVVKPELEPANFKEIAAHLKLINKPNKFLQLFRLKWKSQQKKATIALEDFLSWFMKNFIDTIQIVAKNEGAKIKIPESKESPSNNFPQQSQLNENKPMSSKSTTKKAYKQLLLENAALKQKLYQTKSRLTYFKQLTKTIANNTDTVPVQRRRFMSV